MAKSTKKRPVLHESLEGMEDTSKGTETDLNMSAPEETIEPEPISSPKSSSTIPSLEDSPLFDAGRVVKSYSEINVDLGQETQSNQGPGGESYQYEQTSAPVDKLFENSKAGNPPIVQEPSSGGGEQAETLDLPDQASKEASHDLADFMLDAYDRFVPEVGHAFSKVNEKEIKKLEESGDLSLGAYDEVSNHNKTNKKLLEEKAKADSKYLKKHLRNVLVVKQISASPEALLVIAIIIVIIGQAILISSIRKENSDMMDRLLARIKSNRNPSMGSTKDEVLTPSVEVVEEV